MSEVLGADAYAVLTCPEMHHHGVLGMSVVYDTDDPLVVHLTLTDAVKESYDWRLSRDLLLQGVDSHGEVVGEGDVTLRVRRSDPRFMTLRMSATRRSDGERGDVYAVVAREGFGEFVRRTFVEVPRDREVEALNLDDIDEVLERWK